MMPLKLRWATTILLLASVQLASVPDARSQPPVAATSHAPAEHNGGYRLVWADEFNVDGPPDPQRWAFEHGFVRNQELQWYQPENAACKDGLLVIEARRQRVPNTAYAAGSKSWRKSRPHADYTSACLTTRGLHRWKYGRIEVRARIDARQGLWPAIWTLGEAGEWPDSGEVDIMEYYQGDLLANACWSSGVRWSAKWDSAKKPLSALGGQPWAARFHTWRMDWDRDRIELSVDGLTLNTVALEQTVRVNRPQSSPFREPHYLLLNLAVGGSNGGDPSETEFPATFEVDYVRVYQR
ncbi:Beta-glucanase precursor [Pirellulimonas nuda]|uniref:Beta-glucanase n=1 Tax=Pirellulimonas nuda TaxID=2528009 RepID=A0A518DBL3_9BACT|nr:glycoside hydrolase family 16 protein [Pirellulimonas nuda]QDU88836.1 Beta-glucanase precursor [Pirellulimonas nuda]